ncbi:sufE-like protein 1, chloroplastic/mitochondrial [Solanum stenotomum]|uniref:sufE-like protein 1, chloroplastic/mitochondrial n=1 Tax=Solanum stenotomum TaxID=172797 RepID=UPI0020D0C417|nr:sufE-like protein 1, chloroplastic/mitochondrial [Solanum stenotomum]XP_049398250.1 sufE-like protein 1, chloroplastic/mitochondrial [Solanum stenotomum]XP_049398251.1 sufE-like protein 1, chloroplastic/mitochondrial [Solanum stenotomum]XP_049398252.1 sufE-like protein 1, chloroplastic/mitochondrial [Solanum stenotomum]
MPSEVGSLFSRIFSTSNSPFSLLPLLHHLPSMSISTKIPHPLLHHPNSPYPKTSKSSFLYSTPSKLTFFRSITIERISTKSVSATPEAAGAGAASESSSSSLQPIEELPPKLQEIVKLFQAVELPKAKYEQLLFYGKNLKPLDTQYKTSENKVQGCVSQVWVRAYFDSEKNVVFEADSDSVLTKGLAALLVQGLSGRPVEEILKVSPDFAVLLGLQQSLTPSRNNGFLNMLKLMQKKALQLYVEAEKGANLGQSEISNASSTESHDVNGNGNVESIASPEVNGNNATVGASDDGVLRSRGMRIKEKLEKELRPVELEVEDISYQHAGHAGIRGSDGETHFNLKVVSEEFEGKSLVKRHRMIYGLLQDELQNGLHALSIVAKTPSEVGSS